MEQSDKKPDYVSSTESNYQGRYQNFADWAEAGENKGTAQALRDFMVKTIKEKSQNSPISILDAGCGSGRDMLAFKKDHQAKVSGFDVCQGFVDMCKDKGLENTVKADFNNYFDTVKSDTRYDGIFALASLFHVPKDQI